MGHQAAQCSVGTVNWKNMYGPEAFLLRRPVFWSEIEAAMKAKAIDFKNLEAKAKEYAAARRQGKVPGAVAVAAPVQPPLPQQDPDLPLGWAAAKDSEGKIYYWHRETKKVQWNKPTLEGTEAAAAVAPPPAAAAAPAVDGGAAAVGGEDAMAMQE